MMASVRAALLRRLKLVPSLFRNDPLFRYASIAAVLALILIAVSIGQDMSGRSALSGTGNRTGSAATAPERVRQNGVVPATGLETTVPPVPGSPDMPAPTEDASPPAIAPGRPLNGIDVAPGPRDSFGTIPQGDKPR
ncbi:hypothetical protein LB543_24340 [Mesorhizobium sp. ESP7-2]|uniref:hypothetical protein n=1 Tax=Mesorhizobium sp. ESP7-2 TaxID=2876622 RepID=UPI001CCA5C84|nr:hypothetical protein [Mesorhizobium sp. ESP7-2]MBZ9709841.1 hypothetical protein [Mesorhizobium sp. ESP7-2]